MERENINIETGLSTSMVEERISKNLVNYNDVPPTKTIKQIIISNFCTYFNFLNVFLGGAILIAGIIGGKFFDAIKNCLFMGVIIANSIISTIQEIVSKWMPNAVINIERNGVAYTAITACREICMFHLELIAMKWVKNYTHHNVI